MDGGDRMTRDEMVLLSLDDMIDNAPELGLLALPFIELKKEFERIMKERDELVEEMKEGAAW